ncbi:MAG: Rrf2 family transcriptional regulator [Candidatus Omnitrophica bacterium]|nr:Rrf2 family transcriptional regulator [Candidatus Omnitrophota bacterium]
MKITYKGDYALKAILDLSLLYRKDERGLVTINEIAERIDAPIKFLEQVLLELKKGGFVVSKRGKVGGYLLAKPPARITVGEVVRYIEGPIEPISCVKEGYVGCGDVYKCAFKSIWQDVFKATSNIIDNVTFEDLASRIEKQQSELVYSI